jgi:SAM-dependent methyltransferase
MTLRTLVGLVRSGRLGVLLGTSRALPPYYRVAFLAAAGSSGMLALLADGPARVDRLAAALGIPAAMRDGLEAWLRLGVSVGALRAGARGYALRRLARRLAEPANDAAAALVEEAATLHHRCLAEAPRRMREGRPFTLADVDGPLVARSSRMLEPFVREAVDAAVPPSGPLRLLEVGCGSGVYLHHAATRNAALTGVGLELDPDVARLARANLARWGVADRIAVEVGDVRARAPEAAYDLVTLHNNVNYFPVDARADVLRHVGRFLRPGGRLLVTSACLGGGGAAGLLYLWGAMTAGCGRLPAPAELAGQMEAAGFTAVVRRSLIPGESFWAFTGVAPGR